MSEIRLAGISENAEHVNYMLDSNKYQVLPSICGTPPRALGIDFLV
jgi:hypothetical protein